MPGASARQPLKKGISKKPKQPLKKKEASNDLIRYVIRQEEEIALKKQQAKELAGILHDPDLTTNQKLEAVRAMLPQQTQI